LLPPRRQQDRRPTMNRVTLSSRISPRCIMSEAATL
jgi:hypothetical protein